MPKNKAQSIARYPGGKNGAGVFQTIINQIPPHDLYIEAFAGSAAVFRNKRPAASSIVIDADAAACLALTSTIGGNAGAGSPLVICADARSVIGDLAVAGVLNYRTFIYCDPPYVRSTRRSPAAIYRCEMSDTDHVSLLSLLRDVPAQIMLSGYRSAYYDSMLWDWRRIDFKAMTRAGPAIESLWMNYPEPVRLADYSHLGSTFRERQDLKRQRERWRARLARMPVLKRQALLEAVRELETPMPPAAALGGNADEDRRRSAGLPMPSRPSAAKTPLRSIA